MGGRIGFGREAPWFVAGLVLAAFFALSAPADEAEAAKKKGGNSSAGTVTVTAPATTIVQTRIISITEITPIRITTTATVSGFFTQTVTQGTLVTVTTALTGFETRVAVTTVTQPVTFVQPVTTTTTVVQFVTAGQTTVQQTSTSAGNGFITFGPGLRLVGIDIPARTFRTVAYAASCYWERLRGLSGSTADIIANSFQEGPAVATVFPTDKAFNSNNCGTWTSDLSRITAGQTSPFGPGTFIVNNDIAPGLWRAAGGSSCYWERLRGFGGLTAEIIANDFGTNTPAVQIATTDQGFRSTNCGAWAKIG